MNRINRGKWWQVIDASDSSEESQCQSKNWARNNKIVEYNQKNIYWFFPPNNLFMKHGYNVTRFNAHSKLVRLGIFKFCTVL